MALIMYLTRAPRYKNIVTDEYETVPMDDIVLIEKYFNWKRAKEDGKDSGDTLEVWCGTPESQLPHKYVVNYYRSFYSVKKMYHEYLGDTEVYSLFEQLARFVKTNQVFAWFIKHVMNGQVDKNYYEVSREHLVNLLDVCNNVINSFGSKGKNYVVDKDVAKELLPLMDGTGYFFGVDDYNEMYAHQVIAVANTVKTILDTTDFEKQVIYFNAIW